MREILFRGKRVDNGEWFDGSYVYDARSDWHWIAYYWEGGERDYQVIPETVGQFTGLTDKNGVKIFEGDIVKHISTPNICQIIFKKRQAQFMARDLKESKVWQIMEKKVIEVIGNIYDNPKLIKQ